MKIAYCTNSIDVVGGMEMAILTKANAFAAAGYKVWLLVENCAGSPILPLREGVEVVNLNVRYDAPTSRLSIIVNQLKRQRDHRRKLKKALNAIAPDILITTGRSEKFFIDRLKIDSNPIRIREFHENSGKRQQEKSPVGGAWVSKMLDKVEFGYGLRHTDAVVLLTEEDRRTHWQGRRGVYVIPNALREKPTEVSSQDEKVVTTLGRLSHEKNHASLLRAWKMVVARHPEWRLNIFGDGPERDALTQEMTQLGITDSAELMGSTAHAFHALSQSSIFAFTSLREGFGMAIVEAMACGLPVVSYRCPCGPADIISDGKNGFLVALNDEKTLAECLCQLIENPQLRRQMAAEAIKTAEKYDLQNITAQWIQLFHQLQKSAKL